VTVPQGETCENPFELTAGVQASGDSTGADDDFGSACANGNAPSQPDLVYHFTLTEASGVEIDLNGIDGFDGILMLFKDGCTDADRVGECVDKDSQSEQIVIGLLDPGDYYVVVDGYDAGGAFTLDLSVTPGGMCVDDEFEANGNDTADAAINAGSQDLDTADLDPTTPEPDTIRLGICEGDVDYFLIGHMGGSLDVETTATAGEVSGEVLEAVIDPQTGAISEGNSLGATPYNVADAPRGAYLLRVAQGQSALPTTGAEYTFKHLHGCQGDADDSYDPAQDDATLETAVYRFYQAPDAPIDRSLCGTDVDAFVLQNVAAGDITVTLAGGAIFQVQVEQIVDDGNGGQTTQAYSNVTTTQQGSDLEVTLPAAPFGSYLLSLSLAAGGTPLQDVPYTFDVSFAGSANPPANDTCQSADAVGSLASPVTLQGRTVGAADDLVGPCGGEDVAAQAGKPGAKDVFYALNLPADSALDVRFDGSVSDFYGQVYLLELPNAACPADLSTLTAVSGPDGSPACRAGYGARLRLPALQAGDYLLVVDGIYQEAFFIFPEMWTEGGFELTVSAPATLPPLASCTSAQTLTLPASGQSASVALDNTSATNDLDYYGQCSPGGSGPEQVFTVTPASDATVTFTAEGSDPGFDTILAVREAECEFGTEVACNDDIDAQNGNYGSTVTVTLKANTTYYVIVDTYDGSSVGQATLSVSVQ
jgi:hypothetical protein